MFELPQFVRTAQKSTYVGNILFYAEWHSVSGRKRYNTLGLCKQNRVPTGMLLAPIGNPEPRDFTPLDTPYIFLENGAQTVKMQFDTFPQKIQNRCNRHPCEDEKYSGFHFSALIENYV